MSTFCRIWRTAFAGLAAFAIAAPSQAEWKWGFTPYFWASDVGVDVSVNDHEVFETEADLADLIDNLDFAIQGHFEGRNGRHGFFVDATYMDLGDDDRVHAFAGPLRGEIVAKGDLEETLLEGGGLFNPRGDGTGWSVLYGARVLDVDEELDVRLDILNQTVASRRYGVSTTLVDGLVGARYFQPIDDRWSFLARADVSAGSTELTWNAMTGVGFTFGAARSKTIFVGYRYMEIEFEEQDRRAEIELQNKMGGFITGLQFAF